MKFIKYITIPVLLIILVSCDALKGDPDLPIPLEETMNNTGAFLRILSVESPGFDVADLSTAEYAFVGEVSDVEKGQLVESVSFYASYVATGETNPPTIEEASNPIITVQASDLEISEDSGLPRGRFSVKLQDIMDALGIVTDDLNLGDRFNVRWEILMEDGTTYTNTDISPAVTSGFYTSPFFARASVVQSIPEDVYVGSYTFTQNNASGTFDPIFNGSMTFDAEIQVDPNNTLNGRIVDLNYLAQFGGFPQTLKLTFFRRQDFQTFTADDNWASVPPPSFGTGIGCSAIGLSFGAVTDTTASDFDVNDDSEFTFAIIDNEDGDCGGTATQVTFTATKN